MLWDQSIGENNSISSVQFSRCCVQLSTTPWTAARQASLSIADSWSLLKLVSIESVMPSSHLNLCRPLLLLPSIFPRIQGLFKWVSSSHQVAKVLEFQLQHQSFQWTFRTDFFYAALAENVLADKKDRNKKPILVLKAFTFLYDREIINKINGTVSTPLPIPAPPHGTCLLAAPVPRAFAQTVPSVLFSTRFPWLTS